MDIFTTVKVLQISPFSAYPPSSGGQQRVHGLVSGYKNTDSIYRIATAPYEVESPLRIQDEFQVADRYQELRIRSPVKSLIDKIQPFIPGSSRREYTKYYYSLFLHTFPTSKLKRRLKNSDVVMVEHPWQIRYVAEQAPPSLPIVYSSHNFEIERSERASRVVRRRVRKLEEEATSIADLIIVTSERDKKQYQRQFSIDSPICVAPNAAFQGDKSKNVDLYKKYHIDKNKKIAIFVGSSHPPNVDAARNVLRIARKMENEPIEFIVVGSVCDELERYRPPDNTHLAGFVHNIESYYNSADIGLNPMELGSGSNVKIPEYFAHGLVTVTTPFGARGVPATDNHMVVSDVDGFPKKLRSIIQDDIDVQSICEESIKLFDQKLNWESVSAELFSNIQSELLM